MTKLMRFGLKKVLAIRTLLLNTLVPKTVGLVDVEGNQLDCSFRIFVAVATPVPRGFFNSLS